jgi:hypothetical protein
MEQVEVVKEGRIATSILTLYDNGIIVNRNFFKKIKKNEFSRLDYIMFI